MKNDEMTDDRKSAIEQKTKQFIRAMSEPVEGDAPMATDVICAIPQLIATFASEFPRKQQREDTLEIIVTLINELFHNGSMTREMEERADIERPTRFHKERMGMSREQGYYIKPQSAYKGSVVDRIRKRAANVYEAMTEKDGHGQVPPVSEAAESWMRAIAIFMANYSSKKERKVTLDAVIKRLIHLHERGTILDECEGVREAMEEANIDACGVSNE